MTDSPSHPRLNLLLAVMTAVFVLTGVNTTLLSEQSCLAAFGMLGLLTIFSGNINRTWLQKVASATACLLTLGAFGFVFIQSEPLMHLFWIDGQKLGDRSGNEGLLDVIISIAGLIAVVEATRRCLGWTLPILCLLFVLYALFGAVMPDFLFPHRGFSWERIAVRTFLQGGVFGIALKVMFMYVFLFVLYGALLERTGSTAYMIEKVRYLFRKSASGPPKVAILGSGLMGSLSGSAVANTAATGPFTIPLMRSAGFRAEHAAGIEAAASAGGALMPPIMGAGAYMMLEIIDPPVTYLQIICSALIPASLYYASLLFGAHFSAKRLAHLSAESVQHLPGSNEDAGAAEEARPTAMKVSAEKQLHPYQGVLFCLSLLLLIVLLAVGLTPFRSVSLALAATLVLSRFSGSTRLTWSDLGNLTISASRGGVSLVAAAACVGIILGVIAMTGAGAKLPMAVLPLAREHYMLTLLLIMAATIVLGMGLPSAVCYLLVANIIGQALGALNTPPLAAHLFVFYFGMMSMVTPPVALAAYTAAAIAKADVLKASFSAFRFALAGFALPFAFVLHPEVLFLTTEGNPAPLSSVLLHAVRMLIGILGVSAGLAGFSSRALSRTSRLLLVGAGLLILLTRWEGLFAAGQVLCGIAILAYMPGSGRLQRAGQNPVRPDDK